jgi:hypothetical protein
MINITHIGKAEALRRLYNRAQPLGLGVLHHDPKPMTLKEAEDLLAQQQYLDYLKGRVMKIKFDETMMIDERLYDRDNGTGAAAAAIAQP